MDWIESDAKKIEFFLRHSEETVCAFRDNDWLGLDSGTIALLLASFNNAHTNTTQVNVAIRTHNKASIQNIWAK